MVRIRKEETVKVVKVYEIEVDEELIGIIKKTLIEYEVDMSCFPELTLKFIEDLLNGETDDYTISYTVRWEDDTHVYQYSLLEFIRGIIDDIIYDYLIDEYYGDTLDVEDSIYEC